nr:hypothetical protein GCM10017554_15900 [Acinetobacter modestus]
MIITKNLSRSKLIRLMGLLPFILFPILSKKLVDQGLINFNLLILITILTGALLALITSQLLKYFKIE